MFNLMEGGRIQAKISYYSNEFSKDSNNTDQPVYL